MRRSPWHLLWLVPWILVSSAAFELLWLCLFLPGVMVFPFAALFAPTSYIAHRVLPGQTILAFEWRWLDWWLGNFEDGLLPDLWVLERGGSAFGWFLRNPITNLRFVPLISTKPEPASIRWVGEDWTWEVPRTGLCWFACWQGPYAGIRVEGKRWGFWIGYKVRPRDAGGVCDYRAWGISVACQILRF